MQKIFATYCIALVILLAAANFRGYVFTSLLAGVQKAEKAANRHHK